MHQERLLILQMLADGKITPAEAETLLDSVDNDPAGPEPAKTKQPARNGVSDLADGLAGLANRLASWGAEVGGKVAEEIRDGRVPVLRWLSDCFDGHETRIERTGGFADGEVAIECTYEAGSLLIKGGEGPEFHLTARQRFGRADGPAVEADGNRLTFTANGIVHTELTLPDRHRYRVNLRSRAGRIELAGLDVASGRAVSGAGGISLSAVKADNLVLKSAAGSIDVVALTASDLHAESECGRLNIQLAPAAPGRCEMKTGVGALALTLAKPDGLDYSVRARTDVGGISCGSGLEAVEQDQSVGRRRLQAKSPGATGQNPVFEVDLKVGCGSIKVGVAE